MHNSVMDFNGNSNIGLYIFATDKFVLLGNEVPEKYDEELKNVFKVPIYRITIAGTSLIRVFVAGDDEKILIPSITFDEERKELERIGINFQVINTKLTCLGNNFIITKDTAYINPEYPDSQMKEIEKMLSRRCEKLKISGLGTIGSLVIINKGAGKALISNEIEQEELEELEKNMRLTITPGSVNMGSPYVASGIVCNSNGFVIGSRSGSAEIINADEGLGYLED